MTGFGDPDWECTMNQNTQIDRDSRGCAMN